MKYLVRFSSPQTIPSRIGWAWYPTRSVLPTTDVLQNIGDVVSSVIDTTGSGMSSFTIPWLTTSPIIQNTLYPSTATYDDNACNGYLVFFCVSPPSATVENTPDLVVTIWAACERDSQWVMPRLPISPNGQLIEQTSDYGTTPVTFSYDQPAATPDLGALQLYVDNVVLGSKMEDQSVKEIFDSPFPLPDNTKMRGFTPTSFTNNYVTINDVLQSPTVLWAPVAGATRPYRGLGTPLCPVISGQTANWTTSFSRMFRFWRGSRKFRIVSPADRSTIYSTGEIIVQGSNTFGNDATLYTNATAFANGARVSWNCLTGDFAWNPLSVAQPSIPWAPAYIDYQWNFVVAPTWVSLQFGDDFQVGGISDVPTLSVD